MGARPNGFDYFHALHRYYWRIRRQEFIALFPRTDQEREIPSVWPEAAKRPINDVRIAKLNLKYSRIARQRKEVITTPLSMRFVPEMLNDNV